MANTTNFNWETPDDTDLVKDGAAAIRTLGSAIDTSLVDLKGGTTGQVLSKATNTDMDFTWVAQDDSNAIQNAIVDAKGDLISATAADTPARLAVGANGTVLTADSSEATGLKWAAAAASGGMTLLSTTTFSGTTTTVSSINQSHKHLLIQVDGMTNSGNLEIRLNGSTTGAYLTAVGYTSTAVRLNGQAGPNFTHNASTSSSDISVILWVYSYSDSSRDKPLSASAFFNSTFPDPIPTMYGGYYNSNTAITSIDFVTGNSTSTGTIRLWGAS